MKNHLILTICLLFFTLVAFAQGEKPQKEAYMFEFGLGLGYEYGGIGAHFAVSPVPYASAFLGVGINGGIGFNAGAAVFAIPKTTKHTFRPFLEAMYGYNLVTILVDEATNVMDVNQYYGPSVGLGCEIRFGYPVKRHGFDIVFPRYGFWSDKAWDAYNSFDEESRPALGPWGFSIGYHFEF